MNAKQHPEQFSEHTEEKSENGSRSGNACAAASEATAKMRKVLRDHVYILPNLVTSASLLVGFWSIILASRGEIKTAAMAVLFSAAMDGMDGKVARLTNTASEFGVQYDSLADAVAFGVAPGFLAWAWHLQEYGRLGGAVCALFVACAALRLARFNVSTAVVGKKFFIGIPSPAAGCLIALFVLFASTMPEWFRVAETPLLLLLTLGAGLLMVSQVRYFSFKEFAFVHAHPFRTLVAVVCAAALLVSSPWRMGFLLMLLYMASGLVYTYILSRRDKKRLNSMTGL